MEHCQRYVYSLENYRTWRKASVRLNDRDYLICKNGTLGTEREGWIWGPSDESKAFGYSVKVYLDREVSFLAGMRACRNVRETRSNLAGFRPGEGLTVRQCNTLYDTLSKSPAKELHELENKLVRSISHSSQNIIERSGKIYNYQFKQYLNDLISLQTLADYLNNTKAAIRKTLSQYLYPNQSNIRFLPEIEARFKLVFNCFYERSVCFNAFLKMQSECKDLKKEHIEKAVSLNLMTALDAEKIVNGDEQAQNLFLQKLITKVNPAHRIQANNECSGGRALQENDVNARILSRPGNSVDRMSKAVIKRTDSPPRLTSAVTNTRRVPEKSPAELRVQVDKPVSYKLYDVTSIGRKRDITENRSTKLSSQCTKTRYQLEDGLPLGSYYSKGLDTQEIPCSYQYAGRYPPEKDIESDQHVSRHGQKTETEKEKTLYDHRSSDMMKKHGDFGAANSILTTAVVRPKTINDTNKNTKTSFFGETRHDFHQKTNSSEEKESSSKRAIDKTDSSVFAVRQAPARCGSTAHSKPVSYSYHADGIRKVLISLSIESDTVEKIVKLQPHLMEVGQLDHTLKYEIGLNDQTAYSILSYLKTSSEINALMDSRRKAKQADQEKRDELIKLARKARKKEEEIKNFDLGIEFSTRDIMESRYDILAVGSQINDSTGRTFNKYKTVFADQAGYSDLNGDVHITVDDIPSNKKFKEVHFTGLPGPVFDDKTANQRLFIKLNNLMEYGGKLFIKFGNNNMNYNNQLFIDTILKPAGFGCFADVRGYNPSRSGVSLSACKVEERPMASQKAAEGIGLKTIWSHKKDQVTLIMQNNQSFDHELIDQALANPCHPEFDLSAEEYSTLKVRYEEWKKHGHCGLPVPSMIESYSLKCQEAKKLFETIFGGTSVPASNASIWDLQSTLRADHQDSYVPVVLGDTQQSLTSLDEFFSLSPITREQEQAFLVLQKHYTALTVNDLPELIRQRFLDPLAVEILRDSADYRHKYKAQEVFKNFTDLKKQKELALDMRHRESLIQAGVTTSTPVHGFPAQVLEIKEGIFRSGEISLSKQQLDNYCDGVEPQIIEKLGEQNFKRILLGFLEMRRLLAEGSVYEGLSAVEVAAIKTDAPDHVDPTELLPQDFHILLNNNLITGKEIQNIHTFGLQAAAGPYKRILQQAPIEGIKGIGLTSWGNTCWINTGLQTMLRMISPEQIRRLRPQVDEGLEQLRLSFQRLMILGQDIIKGHQGPSVVTREQSDFIEALLICGQAGKLGGMNRWFNYTDIPEIPQQDSADFVSQLCELLGVYDDGSQSMERVIYYETTIGNQNYYKKKEGDIGQITHALACFRPVKTDPQNIRMIDWFHSITEMEAVPRMVPWTLDDFNPGRGQWPAYNLPSREKCMMKVDPTHFKGTIIALNGTDECRELARKALLNSSRLENNELKLPVIDARDNKEKIMVMRLTGAGLHIGTGSYGHYIHMSLDPRGECEIQDDRIAQPFELYRQYLPEGDQMSAWQEMVEKKQFVPAYCEYEFVRFDD